VLLKVECLRVIVSEITNLLVNVTTPRRERETSKQGAVPGVHLKFKLISFRLFK